VTHVIEAYAGLAKAGVDLVHDHTLAGPALGQYLDVPVVTTVHWTLDGDVGRLYSRLGSRVPLIAISERQRVLAPHVPIVRVIHHGLDVAARPHSTEASGPLLVLARMSPDKGIDIAIEAARRAGAPLILAGPALTETERDYLRERITPMLGGGIEYIGEIGGSDKQLLLASSSAVLMPVRWEEPFGMVAIEALAAGTPVLAFPRGAMPEIIQHARTGFLCAGTAELVNAVRRVGELDRLACRQAAQDRFSSARMARDHAELYAELAHGPSKSRGRRWAADPT
jgi:glycosyltransferase involved in cell wall biosynthesis